MDAERAPLTGADLERWAAGSDPATAAVVQVVAGVEPVALSQWEAAGPDDSGFVAWTPPPADPPLGFVPAGTRLAWGWDAEAPARLVAPPLRLAVHGNIIVGEVVPRLLTCPGVGSAVVPVHRPPGALRRREWSWPIRIGVADDELAAAFADHRGDEGVPAELVDVSDVRTDPGAVDLLVLRSTPAQAAAFVLDKRQLANAVLCFDGHGPTWPVMDAHLAMLRAASASVGTLLVPPVPPDELAVRVLRSLRYLSHAHPFDVAVTAAFDRQVVLAGEIDALADTALPTLIGRRTRQLRVDVEALGWAMAEPPEPPEPSEPPPSTLREPASRLREVVERVATPVFAELDLLTTGMFEHESDEGSRVPRLTRAVDRALDEAGATTPRLLQAYVGSPDAIVADNTLRAGTNAVDLFIGPEEAGALLGPAAPNALLGFDDPAINRVRLTVVLAPLVPRGEPVRSELDVPRTGRSANARLLWDVPPKGRVQARIMVLHRNRVIQTALLGGRIGGAARLTERLVLWDRLSQLDDRQPFDRAFVLNHDDAGDAAVVSHCDGTTTIEALAEIDATTERIRKYLLDATQLTSTGKAATEAARKILIDVAVEGNDLYSTLEAHLARFAEARRIQIVTARTGRFLPLEMVYDRPAPDEDAALCANWSAGKPCGPHCFADADDTTVVCPSIFWGMSRVIERHHTSLTDGAATAFLVTATPIRQQRTLDITHAVLAASKKVRPVDVDKTAAALGPGTVRAVSWEEWQAALKAKPADLLVLLPHTDPAVRTLEISGSTLRSGRVEKRHVTGGQPVNPVVVLFGCDTAGSKDDPAGYATRFMAKGAAVVFSTLTMLLGRHAAAMSQRLVTALQDPARAEQPLGELVAAFRREAVRAGLISALAVTAYGDADWKV